MEKLKQKHIEEIYVLTPMQEGMLFHYLVDKKDQLFLEQLHLSISGRLDLTVFKRAWEFVMETNDTLRTIFCWEGVKRPLQIVLKKHTINLKYHDYSSYSPIDKERLLANLKSKGKQETFNLDKEVPFRVSIYKIEENTFEIVITHHHILYDGWSNGIILKEFFDAYEAFYHHRSLEKPQKHKFKEYVRWTQQVDRDELNRFWQKFFSNYNQRIEGSTRRRNPGKKRNFQHHQVTFPEELKTKIEDFSRRHRYTQALILYGAWGILLKQYNRKKDLIFETTVSGRSARINGIENIVGMFVNTLPLRINLTEDKSVLAFFNSLDETYRDREKYEGTPPDIIHQFRALGKNQLFDSLVVIENYPLDEILMKKDHLLQINNYSITETTQYDLTFIFTPILGMHVQLTYDDTIFNRESLSQLSHDLMEVIEVIVDNPGATISEIDIGLEHILFPGVTPHPAGDERLPQTDNRQPEPGPYPGDFSQKDDVERVLLNIWTQILGIPPGVNDDFFKIGGDSIALVRIFKQINEHFPNRIKVNDFFMNSTINKLGSLLRGDKTPCNRKRVNHINF